MLGFVMKIYVWSTHNKCISLISSINLKFLKFKLNSKVLNLGVVFTVKDDGSVGWVVLVMHFSLL